MDTTTTLFRVKATRATPPGLGIQPERRPTYDAALTQFDELIAAARTATPATRPLPLFYALSQAGRAIAAAGVERGAPWRLSGHGLSAPDLDRPVLDIEVKRPKLRKTKLGPSGDRGGTSVDSFGGIAQLLDGAAYTGALSLGAVWASLPEVTHLLAGENSGAAARPVWLVPETADIRHAHLTAWGRVDAAVVGLGVDEDDVVEVLRTYLPPRAPKPRLFKPLGLDHAASVETEKGFGFKVSFDAIAPNPDGHARTLLQLSPEATGFEPITLMPQLSGVAMGRLTRWWVFLFGLSMLARYEPGRWLNALDLSSSDLAAPIQEALHVALDVVPTVVLDALRSSDR